MKFSVFVPSSTSNLGPGFDVLGLALDAGMTVDVEQTAGKDSVQVEIEGYGKELPRDKENLVARAALTVLAGRPYGKLVLRCKNGIRPARGLGSSAAAAVAGLLIGNELVDNKLDARQLLEYAATIEGHPDNVAPILHPKGGLVACVRAGKSFEVHPLELHPDLGVAVVEPVEFELTTKKSRGVLPATYMREQAVDNVARATLLSQALALGKWDRLARAMEDSFHQPYRAPLVPGLSKAIAAANAVGDVGAALSGSGPSLIVLGPKGAKLEAAMKAAMKAFADAGVKTTGVVRGPAKHGAQVLKK